MNKIRFLHIPGPIDVPGGDLPAKGVTIAYKLAGDEARAAVAICSNKEKEWCKWKGRLISAGRYELAWGNRFNDGGLRSKLHQHAFHFSIKGLSPDEIYSKLKAWLKEV